MSSVTARLRLGLAALLFAFAATLLVQSAAAQADAAASTAPPPSRLDLFAGYSYFHPVSSDINNVSYPPLPFGAVGSLAGYFGGHFGLQVEGNYSPNSSNDQDCAYTAQAGPIARFQKGRFVPFVHALGGGAVVGGPQSQSCSQWGYGFTGGLGFDFIVPGLQNHLAIRPVQADFLYAHIDNGPLANHGATGGLGQVTSFRLAGGLVFRFDQTRASARESPSLNCSTDPVSPFPGDPVTLTASTLNLNVSGKMMPRYLWAASAGRVAGDGPNAAVDTRGLAPGTYQVTGKLVEGEHQRVVATCSTSFAVRPYEPPTVRCAADKAAINAGDPVAVTATASSPQNRPLTYSYAASSGLIIGSGANAGLSTQGVAPGPLTITCSVTDDQGQHASATASVMVATPAPLASRVQSPRVAPEAQSLCAITFNRDRRRPDRVDNEAKGCLDEVALSLNRASDSKLLLVGFHADGETSRNAAERAMNAADYLTHEKGIDASRLDLRVGTDRSRAVSMTLLPPGASVDAAAATRFDTRSVRRRGEAYGHTRLRSAAAPVRQRPLATRRKAVQRRHPRTVAPSAAPKQD